MPLALRGYVTLPPHVGGDFDHGDVLLKSGRVFVAHTANGTLEVIDSERQELDRTVPGCPEGSGVVCAQGDGGLVFAASLGAGKVLVLDPASCALRNEIAVGPKPNGLAWDSGRQHLLVAGLEDHDLEVASLPIGGEPDAIWFNAERQLLYVAIGEPGLLDVIDCRRMVLKERVTTEAGAHTTAFDALRQRLYVFLPGSSRAAVYEEVDDG